MKRGTPAPVNGLSFSAPLPFQDLDDTSIDPGVAVGLDDDLSSPIQIKEERESFLPVLGHAHARAHAQQYGPIHTSPADAASRNGEDSPPYFHQQQQQQKEEEGIAIVKHIASFLSLSDAESIVSLNSSMYRSNSTSSHSHDRGLWSSSLSLNSRDDCNSRTASMSGTRSRFPNWNSQLGTVDVAATPTTPGLMALSPTTDFIEEEDDDDDDDLELLEQTSDCNIHKDERERKLKQYDPKDDEMDIDEYDNDDDEDKSLKRRLDKKRKKWVQEKLTAAVFAHPCSLRSFCLEAHQAALEIQNNRKETNNNPETLREPTIRKQEETTNPNDKALETIDKKQQYRSRRRKRKQDQRQLRILKILLDSVLHNIPLSIMIDLVEAVAETSLDASFAAFHLECRAVNGIVSALCRIIHTVWDTILRFNPFALIEAVITIQFNAVGKTSEVLVSGIQSVATGVGSASTAAFNRLSRRGTGSGNRGAHHNHPMSSEQVMASSSLSAMKGHHDMGLMRRNSNICRNYDSNVKLLRKLSTINSAATVISYREIDEEAITQHAKKRVQRMMHYDVSLRPFEATVILPQTKNKSKSQSHQRHQGSGSSADSLENMDSSTHNRWDLSNDTDIQGSLITPSSSASTSPLGSPFMCTPKSFPPTPYSRQMVMAKGNRFVEDVVFLARDQLRVHGGLESENERTRAMARALHEGSRLAVFNAADTGNGIALTCGQHVATKVGNVLYCSTRSMIPVLRNCFVYFEMSVMTPPAGGNPIIGVSLATLSIGLSTLEMPLNTLVGAWKGSVGLCTTGQILTAGQWCSPLDPRSSSYGDSTTVGCLACVDDDSAFETWDGVMMTGAVTFNVDGKVVSSPEVKVDHLTNNMNMDGGTRTGTAASIQPLQQQSLPLGALHSTVPLCVPVDEELFPTLTLHSPATQVMCRFSAEDILAKSRTSIGAPQGVTVYAIDGSVLFEEEELYVLPPMDSDEPISSSDSKHSP